MSFLTTLVIYMSYLSQKAHCLPVSGSTQTSKAATTKEMEQFSVNDIIPILLHCYCDCGYNRWNTICKLKVDIMVNKVVLL